MTTWIWKDQPDDRDRFFANYDYDHATVSDHLFLGPKSIPPDAGLAVLNAKRYTTARIRRYGCLPSASNYRVIHKRLALPLLSNVSKSELQLFPITVIAKGGERLAEFFAIVPLNAVPCTDVTRSEITRWLAPEFPSPIAIEYKSLNHTVGCLGNLNIARDTITSLVVVSDRLKNALEATHEHGLCFVRPEVMSSHSI